MTTAGALRTIRWTALGLIGLILSGTVVFLESGPKGEHRVVADNAAPGTMAVAGASIGGPFDLIDHKGRAVTDAAYRGRWMLVFFGYTECPDECPVTLQKMAGALKSLGPLPTVSPRCSLPWIRSATRPTGLPAISPISTPASSG